MPKYTKNPFQYEELQITEETSVAEAKVFLGVDDLTITVEEAGVHLLSLDTNPPYPGEWVVPSGQFLRTQPYNAIQQTNIPLAEDPDYSPVPNS